MSTFKEELEATSFMVGEFYSCSRIVAVSIGEDVDPAAAARWAVLAAAEVWGETSEFIVLALWRGLWQGTVYRDGRHYRHFQVLDDGIRDQDAE